MRRKGNIKITGEEHEKENVLIVEDNGIGMSEERLEQVKRSMHEGEQGGFGLTAVNERVKLYFEEQFGIMLESREGQGSRMTVHLGRQQKI